MSNFKLGDVVQLKSGGPLMTIIQVVEENSTCQKVLFVYEVYKNKFGLSPAYYGCTWFVGTKREEEVFPEESLTADVKQINDN